MGARRSVVAIGAAIAGVTAGVVTPLEVHGARTDVLLDGLNSPKGIAFGADGNLVVGQGAFGPPDPVLVYVRRGRDHGDVFPVTEPASLTDVAISPLDGTGWGLSGPMLLHQLADGTVDEVLDIAAYQATDPDPVDQDDFPEESNPYGLAILPNGDALVADAAGNDLVRVTPEGVATTMARFDLELVATDHLPPEMGLPPAITAEAVPTSIAIGADGSVYVGELKGFPFRPGSSHVWRIAPDAEDAWCSVTSPDPACTVHADGLTAIQDIALGAGSRLYVYELAADGVLAFEAGFETGEFPPAVLLELRGRHRREMAAGELSQPGGIVVDGQRVFVTDGVFTSGRLLEVR
jgi:hypothetical protein